MGKERATPRGRGDGYPPVVSDVGPARDLVIVGAGGHGREVFELVVAVNAAGPGPAWNLLGFLDDAVPDGESEARLSGLGARVLGGVDTVGDCGSDQLVAVVAVGDAMLRSRLSAQVRAAGVALAPALVHPTASVGRDVRLGDGSVVAAGSIITTNVEVGEGVQVNVGCSLSHDVILRDHVTLSPGCRLTGGVEVGERSFFGVGAVVGPRVRVGPDARVGAGAVVLHDVAAATTVHGVPARPSSLGNG